MMLLVTTQIWGKDFPGVTCLTFYAAPGKSSFFSLQAGDQRVLISCLELIDIPLKVLVSNHPSCRSSNSRGKSRIIVDVFRFLACPAVSEGVGATCPHVRS